MTPFQDLEHALLTGIVIATLRNKGMDAIPIVNDVEDSTPYFRLKLDGAEAVLVVLPGS